MLGTVHFLTWVAGSEGENDLPGRSVCDARVTFRKGGALAGFVVSGLRECCDVCTPSGAAISDCACLRHSEDSRKTIESLCVKEGTHAARICMAGTPSHVCVAAVFTEIPRASGPFEFS